MRFADDHDARKWKIEQTAIDGGTTPRWPEIMNPIELQPLRIQICEALGWKHKECGITTFGADTPERCWHTPDMKWPADLPPLDANLIQQAREKLLTSENVQMQFLDQLARLVPSPEMKTIYELINATPDQQARAILAAIKP